MSDQKTTLYKLSNNNGYSFYSDNNGITWRESASVRDEDLRSDKFEPYPENLEYFVRVNEADDYWAKAEWKAVVDGVTYTLKPDSDISAYDAYNISVIKEEALNNAKATVKAFKQRAQELGIWKHFKPV